MSSARIRLVALTCALFLLAAAPLVLVLMRQTPRSYPDLGGLVGRDAPVGRTVRVIGRVISSRDGIVTLAPKRGTVPTVSITLGADSTRVGYGPRAISIFTGVLTRPGVVEDATPLLPGPPGSYEVNGVR